MVWPTETDKRVEETGAYELPGQQLKSSQALSGIDHILGLDINAPPACQRLTGIIASIGKSSREIKFIQQMIAAGLNIALINFNFDTIDDHVETIKNIREASENYSRVMGRNCSVAIAATLPGRKIRTGKILDGMVNYTERDKELIEISVHYNLDILITPFVRSVSAVTELRQLLGEKGKRIAIVANIQNIQGFHNLDDILQISNGIMITREELGSKEFTAEKSVIAQKNMIIRANQANIPVFIDAHILSSMQKHKIPLISEQHEIANCILDGADALVLSAVTAIGLWPIETIKVLAEVCKEAEACVWTRQTFIDKLDKIPIPCDQTTGTALAAVVAAQRSQAAAIIVLCSSGKTAQLISKFKPRCPIIAVTRIPTIARQLHMWRAVIPLVYEDIPNADWERDIRHRVKFCTLWAIDKGFLRSDDPYVLVSGWQGVGVANSVRIVYAAGEFLDFF